MVKNYTKNNTLDAGTFLGSRLSWVSAILFILLLLGNGVLGYLYFFRPASTVTDFQKKYPHLDLARNFIDQEDYILNLQPLRDRLMEVINRGQQTGTEITLYMEALNTGSNLSLNPDVRFIPASLNKLPLTMIAMRKVQDGTWRLEDKLVLLPPDVDVSFGDLYKEPVGSMFTVEDLIKKSLLQSDNTAFKILYRNMELTDHQVLLDELGLQGLFDEEGRMSAKEYSRLFRALYTAGFLNRDNSQMVLEWLFQGSFKDFLSRGIPSDIPFAHKFGMNVGQRIYSDAGIIYLSGRPYLLTVLMHRTGEGEDMERDKAVVSDLMKEISERTYKYTSEY